MGIEKINVNDLKLRIKTIFESKEFNREGRIEILTEVGDIGKDIIDNLNTMDKTLYEIVDDITNSVNEYNLAMAELESYNNSNTEFLNNIADLDSRIEDLQSKDPESLTKEEEEELANLYSEKENSTRESNFFENKINNVQIKLDSIIETNDNRNAKIQEIASVMEDYKEAGDVIKESAEKYGRPVVAKNAKNVMLRNETMWGDSANVLGQFRDKKLNKYLNAAGYETNVGGDRLTYYDNIDHEFIAEFDILEKKGENQVGGELRKQTVRTFSYGQTISTASDEIKKKADGVDKKDMD